MKKINFKVSIIIPCFNEEENIKECVLRVSKLGSKTEILVVDDGSNDNTVKIANSLKKKLKNLKVIAYKPNRGKGNAVNTGMEKATGDILIILDADMTVPPEELHKFIKPLEKGTAEFINGSRFKYEMENGAMGILNNFGNKLMGIVFSLALGQKITDSLCGTKALFKKDFNKIGIAKDDPWGDFSLLFGAARLKLKIVEVPVNYKRRMAGESKMRFFSHGFKLIKIWLRQYQHYLSQKYSD